MKRIIAVLAVLAASAVSSTANADEFGRAFRGAAGATAGVIIVGGISCALTRAFLSSSIALCSPNQLRQAGYDQPQYPGRQYRPAYTPPAPVQVADPKTGGTPCLSRSYGWTGVWTTLSDGRRICVKQ